MPSKVNLDALIPREDFEISDSLTQGVGRSKDTLSINDLKKGEFFFSALRKPDFQRETNEWDSDKVCSLIESFLEGDLIPAIILWRNAGSYIFVIDGSHRLSALAAWINDDYGDGAISKLFYDGIIPEEQIEVAEETRKLIRKKIGSFNDHLLALDQPDKVKPEIVKWAKSLGALAIQLQWVQGDSSKAEASFFKINQQASPIDTTELKVLKARKKPNGIAARAIIRSGKGHKYWSVFTPENQSRIQDIAKEINSLLFNPKLNTPIKTLDLPIGGKVYAAQSLPLILDFINIVNQPNGQSLADDIGGDETIHYLSNCRKVLYRINSNHPGSLGLHPAIYFYSHSGRHKPASFYATVALTADLDQKNGYKKFAGVRASFEDLLVKYDYVVQQIVRKHRGAMASYPSIKDFYISCIDLLSSGSNAEQVIDEVMKDKRFSYITQGIIENEISSKEFKTERKSEAFIREAIKNALRCKICNGYIHRNSISIDHIVRKEDGGVGSIDNAQLTHPYCNTTLKN